VVARAERARVRSDCLGRARVGKDTANSRLLLVLAARDRNDAGREEGEQDEKEDGRGDTSCQSVGWGQLRRKVKGSWGAREDAPPIPPDAAFERPPDDEVLADDELVAEDPWYEPASSSTDDAETVALKQVTFVFSGVGATRTMSAH
jgi:hypothetical protein